MSANEMSRCKWTIYLVIGVRSRGARGCAILFDSCALEGILDLVRSFSLDALTDIANCFHRGRFVLSNKYHYYY